MVVGGATVVVVDVVVGVVVEGAVTTGSCSVVVDPSDDVDVSTVIVDPPSRGCVV